MSKETSALGKEPWIHISKRDDIEIWKAWVIRVAAVLLSLVCLLYTSSEMLWQAEKGA